MKMKAQQIDSLTQTSNTVQTMLPSLGFNMRPLLLLTFLLIMRTSPSVIITGACERDLQCGRGWCCAASVWLRGLQLCTPEGTRGDECHPFSHKIPFFGKRLHYTCPCSLGLRCSKSPDSSYRCASTLE
ncbi:toxin MIT1-like [Stegostoma tigrinum]|uniref:toxin MIT1-like n=1 Tax=Stegostoma tigrinum TaxID=3053191 RepID=UPI00202B6FA7|nr:toxin MIT1-like [Stegostoma tigrinum]